MGQDCTSCCSNKDAGAELNFNNDPKHGILASNKIAGNGHAAMQNGRAQQSSQLQNFGTRQGTRDSRTGPSGVVEMGTPYGKLGNHSQFQQEHG